MVLLLPSLWVIHPAGMGFNFNMITSLLPSYCGSSFVFGQGVHFFGGFEPPPVDGSSIAS